MVAEDHFKTIHPDSVAQWRMSHERDTDSFVRSHGRKPKSYLELARWLKPTPVAGERTR